MSGEPLRGDRPQTVDDSIVEISDDDVTYSNAEDIQLPNLQQPSPTPARIRQAVLRQEQSTPSEVIEVESEDDDILITGSNPNPPPLRRQLNSGGNNSRNEFTNSPETQNDDDIQIVNERPIARQPPNAPISSAMRLMYGRIMRNAENFVRYYNNDQQGQRRPTRFQSREQVLDRLRFDSGLHSIQFNPYADSDAVDGSILARIEQQTDEAVDTRLKSESLYNKKQFQEKKEISAKEIQGYVNNITPESQICCELCGITLGQGIPSDFRPDPRYNLRLEKYAKQYRVQAPWFCISLCSEIDIDLSKRVFVAKCGHTYCGRCVKNIGNRPKRTKATPSGLTIANPALYAPPKCPGQGADCHKRFTARSFAELYY